MTERDSIPRGRHAPPLEVRHDRQLQRLSDAAAAVFARQGYADATAEAIAREAGMSKATFYEHFENKEDSILALWDRAMTQLIGAMQGASDAEDAEAGLVPRLASANDAFAIVGATLELASRQIRIGVPEDIADLEPVIERLIRGVLIAAEGEPAAT